MFKFIAAGNIEIESDHELSMDEQRNISYSILELLDRREPFVLAGGLRMVSAGGKPVAVVVPHASSHTMQKFVIKTEYGEIEMGMPA